MMDDEFTVAETASYGILFTAKGLYETWYATWYRDTIYLPNIDKSRFPSLYLDHGTNTATNHHKFLGRRIIFDICCNCIILLYLLRWYSTISLYKGTVGSKF